MRYLIIASLCLVCTLSYAGDSERKVVRIEKNNVEVQSILYTKSGVEYVMPEMTESYGEDRLLQEKEIKQKKLVFWTNLDAAKYKQDKIDLIQTEMDVLDLIEIELAKDEGVIK